MTTKHALVCHTVCSIMTPRASIPTAGLEIHYARSCQVR